MIEPHSTTITPAAPASAAPHPEPSRHLTEVVREALVAVERARDVLRAGGDPLAAAVDSAVTCAATLMVLRASDREHDFDAVRDALGSARALVVELTYAVRELHNAH